MTDVAEARSLNRAFDRFQCPRADFDRSPEIL